MVEDALQFTVARSGKPGRREHTDAWGQDTLSQAYSSITPTRSCFPMAPSATNLSMDLSLLGLEGHVGFS